MLEVIGWLLCVYLFVKGCELLSMKRQDGKTELVVAYFGGFVAIIGAFVFFLLVTVQAESSSQRTAPPSLYN